MSEPASKDDIDRATKDIIKRIDRLGMDVDSGLEGHRQQQSAEHGSMMAKLMHNNEILHWLRAKWERFSK